MANPRSINLYAGVFIPRRILEDTTLALAAKLLYGCIDGLAKSERGCFASSAYLGGIADIKPRAVRYHLAALEKAGYIRRECGPNGRILISVAQIALEKAGGGRQKNARGGGNDVPPYRIDDKLNTPLTPQGGNRRRRKVKLGKEDYNRGF